MNRSRCKTFGSAAGVALAAAASAAILFVSTAARAGTIGFKTDTEVTAGSSVDAKVTLTHTGDETASNVSVRAELLGKSVNGEEVSAMTPTQTHVWNLNLGDQVARGTYALILRTRYSDDNGYPFEVISSAVASVGVAAAPRVFGSIDMPRLPVGGEVTAVVTAKKPPARVGSFEVTLAVPEGLDVTPAKVPLVFDESGKAQASFRISNRRLLTGTSVNMFAIVRGQTGMTAQGVTFPQDDSIRGTLTIGAVEVKVTTAFFYWIASAIAALLGLLEAGAWIQSGGRQSRLEVDVVPPSTERQK